MNRKRIVISNGAPMLWIDQYGNTFSASSAKELRSVIGNGGSRMSKMYVDKLDGRTVCTGYVVGNHWLSAFAPVELPL